MSRSQKGDVVAKASLIGANTVGAAGGIWGGMQGWVEGRALGALRGLSVAEGVFNGTMFGAKIGGLTFGSIAVLGLNAADAATAPATNHLPPIGCE